jgi:hypothetical protein
MQTLFGGLNVTFKPLIDVFYGLSMFRQPVETFQNIQ